MQWKVDIKALILTKEQKAKVYDMRDKHQNTSSLNDEIGICWQDEICVKLSNEAPFFVQPCVMKEKQNLIMEKEYIA